ncbi:MAG: arsinothricin resistance N-acetyltransferase ArsN1 family B [Sphingopyxis sp.]|nr:arsinothricin resistance N-acetyltransferase ArsN1 family B [Sphingopyxis sp.]MDZ3830920.1 arsinothricin resistance N-acetyltransferase ArsN1 family B [Sphingopyxis sp.]
MASDAEAIQAIYAPFVRDTAVSFEEIPPSVGEIASRIDETARDYPYFVAEEAGALLGYAYAGPHRSRAAYRHSVDVTVYVGGNAQRRGVGRALYQCLLPAAADRGYHAAFAGIALPNDASVALHEAFGFTAIGVYREVGRKLGAWHDVGWWQRRL